MKQIILHHSASPPETTWEQINEWHKERKFPMSQLGWYVGYHYTIAFNGMITQTRNDWENGCHCVPNNDKIGICLIGNFGRDEPTALQLSSLEALINQLKRTYSVSDNNVLGHRDLKATECPGKNLYNWLVLYKKIGYLRQQIDKLIGLLKNKPKETYGN